MRVADAWADAAEVQREYGLELVSQEQVQDVDALVVAVGHQQYRDMQPQALRQLCRGEQPVLADVKALFDRHALAEAGFVVFRL